MVKVNQQFGWTDGYDILHQEKATQTESLISLL